MIKIVQPEGDQYSTVQIWEITFPRAFIALCKMLEATPLEVLKAEFEYIDDPIKFGSSIYMRLYSLENLMKRKPITYFTMEEVQEMVLEIYTIEKFQAMTASGGEPVEAWGKKWEKIKKSKKK